MNTYVYLHAFLQGIKRSRILDEELYWHWFVDGFSPPIPTVICTCGSCLEYKHLDIVDRIGTRLRALYSVNTLDQTHKFFLL